MSTNDDYTITKLTSAEAAEVLDFLLVDFVRSEPLNQSIGLSADEARQFFGEVVDAAFKYSLNFVARAHDGSIAGVRLATILHRHDSSNDYVFETQSSEWRVVTLKRLVTHVESKVWELAPSDVNTLLSGLIISVHSAHTRRGLANRLHTRSEEAARLEGCDGAVSTCTAKNSQALLAKLGFKEIFAVQYADWRDENGKVIFKPADGTTKAALVFKRF